MSRNLQRRMIQIGLAVITIPGFGYLPRCGFAQGPAPEASPVTAADPDGIGTQPEITLWVYNYANVSQKTLACAKSGIAHILKKAGVRTHWINCLGFSSDSEASGTCERRMSPAELAVMIFNKFKLPDGAVRNSCLGSAEVLSNGEPGRYVYLSYDHIRDSFYQEGAASPDILAAVAAHEIGHVLLRSVDHSPRGLMRAQWGRQDLQNAAKGWLLFNPQQAERIRAELALRAGLEIPESAARGKEQIQRLSQTEPSSERETAS